MLTGVADREPGRASGGSGRALARTANWGSGSSGRGEPRIGDQEQVSAGLPTGDQEQVSAGLPTGDREQVSAGLLSENQEQVLAGPPTGNQEHGQATDSGSGADTWEPGAEAWADTWETGAEAEVWAGS